MPVTPQLCTPLPSLAPTRGSFCSAAHLLTNHTSRKLLTSALGFLLGLALQWSEESCSQEWGNKVGG